MTVIIDRIPIKMWDSDGLIKFEETAIQQLKNVASLSFVGPHIAVMPDCHTGIGATIGSVIPTENAVIASCVGVDIGCGMLAYKTTLKKSQFDGMHDRLPDIRALIEKYVPHGTSANGSWLKPPSLIKKTYEEALSWDFEVFKSQVGIVEGIDDCEPDLQLGTLGSGNHFIEISYDENNDIWVVIHSGSRRIGNTIGRYFIDAAKVEMKKWMISLPDDNLAYIPRDVPHLFDAYMAGVDWSQKYAKLNREMMAWLVQLVFTEQSMLPRFDYTEKIDCHHNFVRMEHWNNKNIFVTRKGATSAKKDELGIIPGSMGAKSYIVKGLGNKESFNSCSHGAGRAMSRSQARKTISVEEHVFATKTVECRKDNGVLDESPSAYKNIDLVMEAQKDLVTPVHCLKQIICIKG